MEYPINDTVIVILTENGSNPCQMTLADFFALDYNVDNVDEAERQVIRKTIAAGGIHTIDGGLAGEYTLVLKDRMAR